MADIYSIYISVYIHFSMYSSSIPSPGQMNTASNLHTPTPPGQHDFSTAHEENEAMIKRLWNLLSSI